MATKATSLPELPLGLADVETGPFVALLAGVAVALGVGAFVGVAVAAPVGWRRP